eukprot:12887875-Prorocentrum_lima.AAC.1
MCKSVKKAGMSKGKSRKAMGTEVGRRLWQKVEERDWTPEKETRKVTEVEEGALRRAFKDPGWSFKLVCKVEWQAQLN